jgi:uncharacterized protein YbjT (DUF2867 family)
MRVCAVDKIRGAGMILITGAAGKTGRAILKELKGIEEGIRVFVRNQVQADQLLKLGSKETFTGDLCNPTDLEKAVKGVRAVYHICPNMHPEEVKIGEQLIAAARGKIERFVYHSVFHPQIEAMPHHWNKLRVEEILIGSGIDYTIFQPTAYMQNILGQIDTIKRVGVFRNPYGVGTRVSMVDLEDVAAVAGDALVSRGLIGGTFELVGPGYFSQEEIAMKIGQVLGIEVRAEEIPLDEWKARANQSGLGEYQIDTLAKMFSYYHQFNFMGNEKSLKNLLGRDPTTLEGFLNREIAKIS